MATKVIQVSVTILAILAQFGQFLELKSGAYEDFVIQIADTVPQTNCKLILTNLEETLTSASQYLFSALHGRAFLRSATVILPTLWPDSCTPKNVVSGLGETSDLTVLPNDPTRGRLWAQQSSGCGQPGDQIFMGYQTLENKDDTLGHSLVKEFAMYRYGVFEEQGYKNDPIYPMCFYDEQNNIRVTGCSDFPIHDDGICDGTSSIYNITELVDPKARTSIMFAAEAPSVSMFCDEGNHDRYAPTKHNLICQRRNTFDVILSHKDFSTSSISRDGEITDTTPKISYKRQRLTRYVLLIDNTNDMSERESWNFLRTAIRKWIVVDLPRNSEVGILLTSDTKETLNIQPVGDSSNRDTLSSNIPYTLSDAIQSPCLHCAVKTALGMFSRRDKERGVASSVIIIIAPGMNNNTQVQNIIDETRRRKVRIATINYPNVIREHRLDILGHETSGAVYTVIEKKANVESSLLTTYFQLSNALYNIIETYYAGNINDLPLEIYRREITDGRLLIEGTFVLENTMGEPAKFLLYTHSAMPLIKDVQLISPSQVRFTRSDTYLAIKIITMTSNISEPGTWTYRVEQFPGNPQPHFIQVMATPKSKMSPIIRANFWIRRNQPGGPLVLYAEVKRGDYPIHEAKLEVRASKAESNGSISHKETFELYDTGSGDPDITKGDGVYTRYYSAARGGPGIYTFEVTVTNTGNTAYTWQGSSSSTGNTPCCGSSIPSPKVETLSPFQRVLSPITMEILPNDIVTSSQIPVGRILDLQAEVIPEDMKARLSWTSPDMGGHNVVRYEVKYATTMTDIADHFETVAKTWNLGQPFPLAAGSETTFALDMSQDRNLLDKPLYFAIRAIPHQSTRSTVSNWVRVLVPSPPPPPTVPPTFTINDPSPWPFDSSNVDINAIGPNRSSSSNVGLEVILPVAIGCILLVILLVLYFCFCVKRRNRNDHKKAAKANALRNDKINSNITIVPSSPVNNPQPVREGYTNQVNETDHHTIGVPIGNYGYDEDPKKRYSLVQQQEQQLIEELKQQQMVHQQREQMNTPNNNYGGLSVISNGTLQRNPPALSPFNSWSASQLLHEHERRHSPLENMMQEEQMLPQQQEMLINGPQLDHMSLNGQNMDHISLSSHQVPEHYGTAHIPPPVPPLPVFSSNGYPVNYSIYGVHQPQMVPNPNHSIYQTMQRNEALAPFNTSLQGSLNSVNSGEKKRRNVTMV